VVLDHVSRKETVLKSGVLSIRKEISSHQGAMPDSSVQHDSIEVIKEEMLH